MLKSLMRLPPFQSTIQNFRKTFKVLHNTVSIYISNVIFTTTPSNTHIALLSVLQGFKSIISITVDTVL